jgi:hypothetical protein
MEIKKTIKSEHTHTAHINTKESDYFITIIEYPEEKKLTFSISRNSKELLCITDPELITEIGNFFTNIKWNINYENYIPIKKAPNSADSLDDEKNDMPIL